MSDLPLDVGAEGSDLPLDRSESKERKVVAICIYSGH